MHSRLNSNIAFVACVAMISWVAQSGRAQDEMHDASPAPDLSAVRSVDVVRDVVYATITNEDGSTRELLFDAAVPRGVDEALPAVVYIHGGGWANGDKQQGNMFCQALAGGGYVAVSIGYRLAGEATYPAAVHDCKAAIRFLRANAEELGIDADRIGVWGHSAGGHLSALLGTSGNTGDLDGEIGTTGVPSSVRCVASLAGPTDLTRGAGRGSRMIRRWLGGREDGVRERAVAASPVTYVDEGDPPFLLVHGSEDRLVPLRQARLLESALRGKGVEVDVFVVDGAGHGLRSAEAYDRVAAFFDTHLGGDARASVAALREELAPRRRDQPADSR